MLFKGETMKYIVSYSNSEEYIGLISSNDFSFPFTITRQINSDASQETVIEQSYPAIEGLLVDISKKDYFNIYIAIQKIGFQLFWTGYINKNGIKIQSIKKVPVDLANYNSVIVKEQEASLFTINIKVIDTTIERDEKPVLIPDTFLE